MFAFLRKKREHQVDGCSKVIRRLLEQGGKPIRFGDDPRVTATVRVHFASGAVAYGVAGIGQAKWQLNIRLVTNHHGKVANLISVEANDRTIKSVRLRKLPKEVHSTL